MKKFFAIAAALVLFGTQAFAQFSVGAGYINSTQSGKYKDLQGNWQKNKNTVDLNGAYVGANYTIDLSDAVNGLGITPGIYFTLLAGKDKDIASLSYTDIAANLPININYGFDLTGDFKLFAYAGPIFQLGLIRTGVDTSSNPKTTINYFKDQTLAGVVVAKAENRFNIYLGGGLGFEVNNQIQVILGYNHSLMNIMNDDDLKAGRGQITVGLGYKF